MSMVAEISQEEISAFWSRATKSPGCWGWNGSADGAGYWKYRLQGKSRRVHRIAFELTHGAIPDGMVIDHICHNRSCTNPQHLRLATRKQNAENLGTVRANNKSGVRGVRLHKPSGKWRAVVMHNRKTYQVGYFHEIADVEAAVIAMRNELFTHNTLDRKKAA